VAVLAFFGPREKSLVGYQYTRQNCIMTQSELRLFFILKETVGEKYEIFPQIHLPSILNHNAKGQNWFGAFRHIDEKSVDFVLCEKVQVSPVLVIEFDDRSRIISSPTLGNFLDPASRPRLMTRHRSAFLTLSA